MVIPAKAGTHGPDSVAKSLPSSRPTHPRHSRARGKSLPSWRHSHLRLFPSFPRRREPTARTTRQSRYLVGGPPTSVIPALSSRHSRAGGNPRPRLRGQSLPSWRPTHLRHSREEPTTAPPSLPSTPPIAAADEPGRCCSASLPHTVPAAPRAPQCCQWGCFGGCPRMPWMPWMP